MGLTHVEAAILGAILGPAVLVALLYGVRFINREPKEFWDEAKREPKNNPNTCGRIALWLVGIIILLVLGMTVL
jgi:hypothetical protein